MIYTTFAEVYDQLMDQSLYQRWRDYVVKRVKPSHQPLLELAGGSGFLAVLLAQSGYQVTDFDLSEEMLTLAEEKADAAGMALTLLQGDMRDLQALPEFPIVTCFDDSICYMQNLDEVQQVFTQVASRLPTGGDFLLMLTRFIKWIGFFRVICTTIKRMTLRSYGIVLLVSIHIALNMTSPFLCTTKPWMPISL